MAIWADGLVAPPPTLSAGTLEVVLNAPVGTLTSGTIDSALNIPVPTLLSDFGTIAVLYAPAATLASGDGNYAVLAAPVGTLVAAEGNVSALFAPVITLDSGYGNVSALFAPVITLDSGDGNTLSALALTPTLSAISEFWSVDLTALAPTLDASIPSGLIIFAPAPTLDAQSYLSEFIGVSPAPTIFIGFDGGMILTAPAPQIFTILFHPTDVATLENPYAIPFPAWAINYETNAPSRYDELPANSMCLFNGKTYIACAAGIYEIGADDDAGRPIHASATVAQTNFGSTKNKRIPYVYVGMRSSGVMQLKAIANNQSDRYYALNAIGGAVRGSRADIGKGLEGQYWQFRVDNVDGADFELDSIEFKPTLLSRHGV
jgi:hypothetical protein